MKAERIADLFAAMQDAEEGVNSFIMTALLDQMVGRSLEAAIPVLELAHDALRAAGPVRLPSGANARVLVCPEGPHGGVWRKAFSIEAGGMPLVTVLEVAGEPDPEIDRLIDNIIPHVGERERTPRQPGPCGSVRIYCPPRPEGIASVLAADARDDWSADKAFETRAEIEPRDGEAWKEYRRSTVSGPGLGAWPAYFGQVRELFAALGLTEAMTASAREVMGRNWADTETHGDYRAARAFGTEAAAEDCCLPGPACVAALSALDRLAAEAAMRTVAPEIARLAELLPRVADEDGHFECNDGRNQVRLVGVEGDVARLVIADQNSRFEVAAGPHEVQVLGQRGGGLARNGRAVFDVAFDLTPEAVSMRGDIGLSADAIRAWNGFKSGVLTLALCAHEEAEDALRAGPGGRR